MNDFIEATPSSKVEADPFDRWGYIISPFYPITDSQGGMKIMMAGSVVARMSSEGEVTIVETIPEHLHINIFSLFDQVRIAMREDQQSNDERMRSQLKQFLSLITPFNVMMTFDECSNVAKDVSCVDHEIETRTEQDVISFFMRDKMSDHMMHLWSVIRNDDQNIEIKSEVMSESLVLGAIKMLGLAINQRSALILRKLKEVPVCYSEIAVEEIIRLINNAWDPETSTYGQTHLPWGDVEMVSLDQIGTLRMRFRSLDVATIVPEIREGKMGLRITDIREGVEQDIIRSILKHTLSRQKINNEAQDIGEEDIDLLESYFSRSEQ